MRSSILAINTILLFALLGCEKAADISSPVKYEKENVSFLYPQNWKITDDAIQKGVRYLIVESPADAIFIVKIYSKKMLFHLMNLLSGFHPKVRKKHQLSM